jgi:hypothetical protein
MASAATSMAQVYSVNVVGYINLNLRPGFNLVANQLNASPNNGLNAVLPGVTEESQVLTFAGGTYTTDIYLGGAWLNAVSGDPSPTTVSPGDGFFFFNPAASAATVTLVGEVRTGNGLQVTFPPGYSLKSSIVPQDISLIPANGITPIEESQYLTFNATGQSYDTPLIYLGGAWLNSISGDPADARPVVGQGFFFFNPANVNQVWLRDFNPNTP